MVMAVRHSMCLEALENDEGSFGTDVETDREEDTEESESMGLDGGQGTIPSVQRRGQRV